MSDWRLYDSPTPEERQRDQHLAELQALEQRAIAICNDVFAYADKDVELSHVVGGVLSKVGTIFTAQGKSVFKRAGRERVGER